MKRSLPVAISAIAGIILLGDYFLNIPVLKTAAGEVQDIQQHRRKSMEPSHNES